MRSPSFLSFLSLIALIPTPSFAGTPSYFHITAPAVNTTWTNNGLNVMTWVHADDGVSSLDIELANPTSANGVILVAKRVPTSWKAFNVVLKDTPEADDYVLIFLNSENSAIYSTSSKFAIRSNGTAATTPAKDKNGATSTIPTATVSGGPNPTMQFAATYDGVSAAGRRWDDGLMASLTSIGVLAACALLGVIGAL